MREYYSILGLNKKATETEIITAYRKLAAKFHPDANANDPFFAERYRELQEAYNMLINPIKRAAYDSVLDPKFAQELQVIKDKEKPIITVFEISKKAISAAEPITIRWQTIHASEVEIDFIGSVEAEGTKTLRLPFEHNEVLKIAIHANNPFINESASKYVEVKNKDFDEKKVPKGSPPTIEQKPLEPQKTTKVETKRTEVEIPVEPAPKKELKTKEKKINDKKSNEPKQRKERPLTKEERLAGISVAYEDDTDARSFRMRDVFIYIVLIVLLVFVAVMAIFAYSLNPIM